MKKITYGLFIYICLTTIIGHISALDNNQQKSQCESTANKVLDRYLQAFKADEKQCNVSENDFSSLDYAIVNNFICTAIVETMNIICKLNSNLTFSLTDSVARINESRNDIKNLTILSSEIIKVISNSSYVESIDRNTHPYLVKFNDELRQRRETICASLSSLSYNPLCLVLLWTNKVLADTRMSVVKNKTVKTLAPMEHKPEPKPSNSTIKANDSLLISKDIVQYHSNPLLQKKITPAVEPKHHSEPKKVTDLVKQTPESAPNNVSAGDIKQTIKKSENITKPDEVGAKVKGEKTNQTVIETEPKVSIQKDTDLTPDEDDKLTTLEALDKGEYIDDVEMGQKPAERVEPNQDDNKIAEDQRSVYPVPADSEPPQHFFAYFMAVSLICLIGYIGYHKKHKIMGIIFEGRKSRGGRGRRRPNTAGYRKLDCTLEEAVTSQCNSNVTHVIY